MPDDGLTDEIQQTEDYVEESGFGDDGGSDGSTTSDAPPRGDNQTDPGGIAGAADPGQIREDVEEAEDISESRDGTGADPPSGDNQTDPGQEFGPGVDRDDPNRAGGYEDIEFDEEGQAVPTDRRQDLADPGQEFGPGVDRSDPNQVDIEDLRFAEDETEVEDPLEPGATRTYREGEAVPTTRQQAGYIETGIVGANPGVDRDDIRITRTTEGFEVHETAEGRQERRDARRHVAARQADEQLDEDVSPSDIDRVTDEGRIVFTDEFQQERQANLESQIEQGLESQVSRRRSGITPGTAAALGSLGMGTGAAAHAGASGELVDLQRGEDFTIWQTPEGPQGRLTEQFFVEQVREQTGVSSLERGEDIVIDRDGESTNVGLTDEGRRETITARALERGTVDGVRVQEAGQLEFDDEGTLVDVEPYDPGVGEKADEIEGKLSGPGAREVAIGLALSHELIEEAGQASDSAVSTTLDFSEDIPLYFSTPGAPGGPIKEVNPEGPLKKGLEDTVAITVGFPSTIQSGTEVIGEGGAYTVEEGLEEGVSAGADVAATRLSETAEFIAENPGRTGVMLGATGGIMGGARVISPRANLATRAAIQPGEELLGYGGSAAFSGTGRALSRAGDVAPGRVGRGVSRAGAGAQRASDVLFPQNEPLIFSEEAAIMAGRGVVSRLRGGADRVRDSRARAGDIRDAGRESLRTNLPGVEFDSGGDGLLEIRPELREQLAEAPSEAGRRVGERVGDIGRGFSERIASAATPSRGEVGPVSGALRGAEISGEARLRQAAREGPRLAQDFGASIGMGISRTARRPEEVPEMVSSGIQSGLVQADVGLSMASRGVGRAGERVGRGVESGVRTTVETGRQAPSRARDALLSAELSAEAGARGLYGRASRVGEEAGQRVGEVGPTIGERIRRATDPGEVGRFEGAIRGGEMSARAFGERAGQTGPRIGQGMADLAPSGDPGPISGALSGAEISTRAATREAAQRMNEAGRRVGTSVGGAFEALSDAPRRVGETTVRLEGARPGRRDIVLDPSQVDLEVGDMGLPEGITAETESDAGDTGRPAGSGSNVLTTEVSSEADSGVAVQRVVETDLETERTSAPASTAELPRTELDVPERAEPQEPTLPAEPRLDETPVTGTDLPVEPLTESETVQDIRPEVGPRTDTELDSELDQELDQELDSELDQELDEEMDQELELELETETENEIETELFPDDDDRADSLFDPAFEEEEEVFATGTSPADVAERRIEERLDDLDL